MKNQNVLTTAILLSIALIVIPVFAIFYDEPLIDLQKHVLKNLVYAMFAVVLVCYIDGELTKKLTVIAMGFSKTAMEKITAAGGKVEVI